MKVVCCNKCFEKIARDSTSAARAWMDLCIGSSKMGKILGLKEWNVPDSIDSLKKLEEMGYIATLDGFEYIKIKVHGQSSLEFNEEEVGIVDTYCIDRQEHGHD